MSDKVEARPGAGKTTYAGPSLWVDGARPGRVRVCAGGLFPCTAYGVTLAPGECREFVRDPDAPHGYVPLKE